MTKIANGIIAFCGSKGAGKNTAANFLKSIVSDLGIETEELAIAGHLKEVCSEVFNLNMEYFIDQSKKEIELPDFIVLNRQNIESVLRKFDTLNKSDFNLHIRPHLSKVLRTPRNLLQYVGTEILHPLDPLIHVKTILKNKDPNKLTILTDLRFINEFNFFHMRDDFFPVYVKNSAAEIEADEDPHPSERELHNFKHTCYLLENENSFLDLQSNLSTMVESWGILE